MRWFLALSPSINKPQPTCALICSLAVALSLRLIIMKEKEPKLTRKHQEFFEHISEICKTSRDHSCYKSVLNIAEECGMSPTTATAAKRRLVELNLIKITKFSNGKRKNKRDKIELVKKQKLSSRNKLYENKEEYKEKVKWEEFNKYSAEYINNLSKLEQIDLYVELGLRVVPLHYLDGASCSCRNENCKKPAKHPAIRWKNYNEKYKTSSDFWRENSENLKYNVGILLPPDVAIIDVDVRKFGHITFQYLEEELGSLPDTLDIKTGGGGFHRYFLRPKDIRIVSDSDALGLGVDVLASGRLVVAPPSIHPSGNKYVWTNFQKPEPLPDDYLENLIIDAEETISAKSNTTEGTEKLPAHKLPEKILKGFRTNTLFKYASSLRGIGLNQQEILVAVTRENDKRCEPKLDSGRLKEIAKCAAKYPTNEEKKKMEGAKSS